MTTYASGFSGNKYWIDDILWKNRSDELLYAQCTIESISTLTAMATLELYAQCTIESISTLTADAADTPDWVAHIVADDIVGNEFDPVSTWIPRQGKTDNFVLGPTDDIPLLIKPSNALGSINGHNTVLFMNNSLLGGSSASSLVTTNGGEFLTGDWYMAAVFRYNALGTENIMSFGNREFKQRRSLLINPEGLIWFIGEQADQSMVHATLYDDCFVEIWYRASDSSLSANINGINVISEANIPLLPYSSNALVLGVNPSPSYNEPAGSFLAEAWYLGEVPNYDFRESMFTYVNNTYAIQRQLPGIQP
jgi:hypothetical protein